MEMSHINLILNMAKIHDYFTIDNVFNILNYEFPYMFHTILVIYYYNLPRFQMYLKNILVPNNYLHNLYTLLMAE